MHRKMSPVTTIFAREKNLCLGKGSFPISVDSFLGLWNRPKYLYDNPSSESTALGFRVASVPEPGSLLMTAIIAVTGLIYFWRKHA